MVCTAGLRVTQILYILLATARMSFAIGDKLNAANLFFQKHGALSL